MGRFIDIEYDGMREISDWASASDWPDDASYDEWKAESTRRKDLLLEQYGFAFDEYDRLRWAGDEQIPHYANLTALIEDDIVPGLAEEVRIMTREFPSPQPGEVYRTADGIKSFSEVTLSERLAALDCRHCRSDGFMGGYYYEAEDDDGTLVKCRGCWRGLVGDPEEGVEPALPDDFGRITRWHENGQPAGWKGCSEFDWD